jgi:hypothetical protein
MLIRISLRGAESDLVILSRISLLNWKTMSTYENNIKMDVKEVGYEKDRPVLSC